MFHVHRFEYFEGAIEELAVLVDRFLNVEMSDVGLCVDGINCDLLVLV